MRSEIVRRGPARQPSLEPKERRESGEDKREFEELLHRSQAIRVSYARSRTCRPGLQSAALTQPDDAEGNQFARFDV